MNYYPNNTLTNYTTQLPSLKSLTGSWEVGLVEIQYPHNWYNMTAEDNKIILCGPTEALRFPIPAGYLKK